MDQVKKASFGIVLIFLCEILKERLEDSLGFVPEDLLPSCNVGREAGLDTIAMLRRGDWRVESGTAQPGLSDSQWTEERHAAKPEASIRLRVVLSQSLY